MTSKRSTRIVSATGSGAAALVLCATLGTFTRAALADEDPRIAIWPAGYVTATATVDLVETALSKTNNLVLLERAHLSALLREQAISLSAMSPAERSVSVGRMLKCNIFIDLHCPKPSEDQGPLPLRLTGFDARTGVRLCDTAIAPAALDRMAASCLVAISECVAKWKRRAAETGQRTVSVTGARNVGLRPEQAYIPALVVELLEKELLRSPDVALLERSRLEHVNAEAGLSGDERGALLASAVILDVDVSRVEEGVRIRASLSEPSGRESGAVEETALPDKIVNLVASLGRQICSTVQVLPATAEGVNLGLEADLYQGDISAAVALARGALNRDPGNQDNIIRACLFSARRGGTRLQSTEDETVANGLNDLEDSLSLLEHIAEEKPAKEIGTALWLRVHSPVPLAPESLVRFRSIQRRLLAWRVSWAKGPPARAIQVRDFEACSANADETIRSIRQCLREGTAIGDHLHVLGTAAWRSLEWHFAQDRLNLKAEPSQSASKLFGELGDEGIRELYALCGDLSRDSPPNISRLLARTYLAWNRPSAFDNPTTAATSNFCAAARMVIADPRLDGEYCKWLDALNLDTGCRPDLDLPAFHWTVIRETRRIAARREESRCMATDILSLLDGLDHRGAEHPGAYLERAVRHAQNNAFTIPEENAQTRETIEKRLRDAYQKRYGRPMPELRSTRVLVNGGSNRKLIEFRPPLNRNGGFADGRLIEACQVVGDDGYVLLRNVFSDGRGEEDVWTCANPDDVEAVPIEGTPGAFRHRKKSGCMAPLYEVCRVDFRSGEARVIGSMRSDWPFRHLPNPVLPGACRANVMSVGTSAVCVATDKGLMLFPFKGRPSTMGIPEGLPGNIVGAVAEAEGFLYMGCGSATAGYFVRCGLDGTAIEILASSARRERRSALDNCKKYLISNIIHDRKKRRLILVQGLSFVGTDWNDGQSHFALWSFTLPSGPLDKMNIDWGDPYPYSKVFVRPESDNESFILSGNLSRHKGRGWYRVETFTGKAFLLMAAGVPAAMVNDPGPAVPTDAAAFLQDGALYRNGNGRDWRLVTKLEGRTLNGHLPALDGELPLSIHTYEGNVVVATRSAVWLYNKPPSLIVEEADESEARDTMAPAKCAALHAYSLTGGILTLDGETRFRLWPRQPLCWNDIAPGTHSVTVEWCDQTWATTCDLVPGTTNVVVAFPNAGPVKTMSLTLGLGAVMDFVWIPEDHTGARQASDAGFWMAQYPVTWDQYHAVVNGKTVPATPARYPAFADWRSANLFCDKLMERCGGRMPDVELRLPTVEEWRCAATAHIPSSFISNDSMAGYSIARTPARHPSSPPLGRYMPTPYWLYDMCMMGEWCIDKNDTDPHDCSLYPGADVLAHHRKPDRLSDLTEAFRIVMKRNVMPEDRH